MLERMRDILERIDELNTSFRGMSRRHSRRQEQSFSDALTQAQKAPAAAPPSFQRSSLSAVTPLASLSPVSLPAPQYLDLIKKYSEQNGLNPQLIQKVIQTESNFDPRCVSKRGAQGLMQLMPETAREMGVSNPFDPEQNIAGGSRYLAMMLERFGGNMSKALAAYNAGPTVVQTHGGIPPFPETKRFVSKVLGLGNK
ncbi:hypothetical protein AUK22_08150 [bacterium CG2_30_54_10]|nr:MAG: hypothetical protein AUK22_08150 [bacterium CG2_30_54_10]